MTSKSKALLRMGLDILEAQDRLVELKTRSASENLSYVVSSIHDAWIKLTEAEDRVASALGNQLLADARSEEEF